MKRFFDCSRPVLTPRDLVTTFTKRTYEDLTLPKRALIVFDSGDLRRLLGRLRHSPIHAWSGFRAIYRIDGKDTILTRSYFGGPNIAALVEELACFGVEEFIVWGYCGAINEGLELGDVIAVRGALREDGVSFHYIDDSGGDIVYTDWIDYWDGYTKEYNLLDGIIWSCDAIYRETEKKIEGYNRKGILAVEMEVASFYSVCKYRGVKAIAFVVVSDLLINGIWKGGFHDGSFKRGAKRLFDFIIEKVI
ncbi:MAG TPA: hypothetical protein PLR38_02675 [Syntrophorhabdaceae bacterium]|nr:hypothetical protein [Syntrophorhabdaceae bacterium]HOL04636.1 hypothetical protein [Syntrophorhabdaceae bacterium]HPP41307.1 hypothetical protein [Syntrophorhabdaceae bacterium]